MAQPEVGDVLTLTVVKIRDGQVFLQDAAGNQFTYPLAHIAKLPLKRPEAA